MDKYFYENAPQYFVAAAASLPGIALHPETSFPVGKVEFYSLYPLSFIEFAALVEDTNIVKPLKDFDTVLFTSFKSKYIDLLKQYYFVGGMPEAVNKFIEKKDYAAVQKIHKNLLLSYEQDFSKHAPGEIVPRISQLWHSISAQLAKENRKFIFSLVKKGSRAKDFEIAIQWLFDAGLIYKINRVSKLFFTIEMCAKFQPKTVPLNTKKLISFNPSFPPSFINNRHTFIYTGKIIEA